MDPNYFVMEIDRVAEVLLAIVALSFIVERALSIVFESRFFIENVEYKITRQSAHPDLNDTQTAENPSTPKNSFQPIVQLERKAPSGIKEMIAFAVSVGVCWYWKFDCLSVLLPVHSEQTWPGVLITGAVIAGGSKAAIKLFKDWMNVKSSANAEIKEFKNSQATHR